VTYLASSPGLPGDEGEGGRYCNTPTATLFAEPSIPRTATFLFGVGIGRLERELILHGGSVAVLILSFWMLGGWSGLWGIC